MNFWDRCLIWFGNRWPGKKLVRRFIAGNTMKDAFLVAQKLNSQGFEAIINFLGEEVKDLQKARENARMYSYLIRQIKRRKLKARVSIKPSQIGLRINRFFYRPNLFGVGRDALIYGIPLEIDMETEETVDATVWETIALSKHYSGLDLRQAMAINFKESFAHLYNLAGSGAKIRLCKGAYPSVYGKKEIRERFLSAADYLLEHDANPDFATHDLNLLGKLLSLRENIHDIRKSAHLTPFSMSAMTVPCGFQFLLGLRKKTWKELCQQGERTAIYVAFGSNWLPYAKRRWQYIVKKSLLF